MRFQKSTLCSTLCAALFTGSLSLPTASMAAGTITFTGEVTNQTCTVKVAEAVSPEVKLDAVSTTQLTALGETAGLKPFTVTVSGCNPNAAGISINTLFAGQAVENGMLKNQETTNPAGFVALQLLRDTAESADSVIPLNGTTSVGGLTIPPGQTEGSKTFAVRYRALGQATAGLVKSVVNYDISYP